MAGVAVTGGATSHARSEVTGPPCGRITAIGGRRVVHFPSSPKRGTAGQEQTPAEITGRELQGWQEPPICTSWRLTGRSCKPRGNECSVTSRRFLRVCSRSLACRPVGLICRCERPILLAEVSERGHGLGHETVRWTCRTVWDLSKIALGIRSQNPRAPSTRWRMTLVTPTATQWGFWHVMRLMGK